MMDQPHNQPPLEWQYQSPANLAARAALHARFSTNPRGWFPWVFDQFDLPSECRILEIGCGAGVLWQANRHRIPAGWRLVLTDTSEGMLATVGENLGGLPQVEAIAKVDAQSIPFDNGSFDAVIANHMLYHVPELDTALSEASRILRPGGTFLASTVGQENMREFHQLLASYVTDTSLCLEQQDIAERFSLENGKELLAHWFADVEVRTYLDALAVNEVEPLVAYAQSLATGPEPVLSGERLEQFKAQVAERIRRDGAFHIGKSSGMFVARKTPV
jgi:ubiquinone/menaquinone biosynthesis C-methylase UbiE